eukprot:scaffold36187_cov32-Tisochrysis_lutea.AAC.1
MQQACSCPLASPGGSWTPRRSRSVEREETDQVKFPDYAISHSKSATRTMGIGLLHWPSLVKALQAKWILNYLNASKAL